MSQVVFDAVTRVYWVPGYDGITDINEPEHDEITAGTDITEFVTKDGLTFGSTNNRVPVGNLATAFAGEIFGTYGYQLSLKMFRDDENDTAWDMFPRKSRGYLVICPFGPPEVSERAHVFKVECGQRELQNSAENERQTFVLPFAAPEEPALDAVVHIVQSV